MKIPTAWMLIFGRSSVVVREAIVSPQKALTRMLTPADAGAYEGSGIDRNGPRRHLGNGDQVRKF